MKPYRREQRLKKIGLFYDDDLIKAIAGIRRCGKPCLMETVAEELKGRGIAEKDIVRLDPDSRGNRSIKAPRSARGRNRGPVQRRTIAAYRGRAGYNGPLIYN